ncbi:tail completion protein gp17 [Neorhodopirellula pilleata]|uniref:DUF3168 domain-containing protein n=1 Tax=Neorhodopirellula pilleata TaxID=2714738 RepID=A0A5C5ZWL0_9BACT|nr:DUF3168 domain-containing protein [Neorhodopirellula pilleata]TWT91391.1 hypothetical protein Pla100_52410 [Neorhodopirellula pilleata]TWT91440.1 hypothetical protein Pla100_52900 [Neorhodopirellula pilleata]
MNGPIRAIRAIILGNAALAAKLATPAALGGGFAVRPGSTAIDDRPPYVLLWKIDDRPVEGLTGPTVLREAIVQVESYSPNKSEAAAIAAAILSAVQSFGRGNADDVWVASITERDSNSREEPDPLGGETLLAVEQTDFRMFYRDNNPPTL